MSKGPALESWKEIAAHLHRTVRTCQQWERDHELPIHRLDGSSKARVFAFAGELDRWLEENARTGKAADPRQRRRRSRRIAAFGVLLAGGLAVLLALRPWSHERTYHSIAVLPLEVQSGDPAPDPYSVGLAEELIARLFQVRNLRVAEIGPLADYRTSRKSYQDVRRDLDVEAILDLAILRKGRKVRISAKLVDAETGRTIWADGYERESEGLLALQAEIARAIVREVGVRLAPQEGQRLGASVKVVPEAYEAYLQGKELSRLPLLTGERAGAALDRFRQAIDMDPGFAPFYWAVVHYYALLHSLSLMPFAALIVEAENALKAGLELDPDSADAHLAAGVVHWLKWEWDGARQELERALELSPGNPTAHSRYTDVLHGAGRFTEAIASARRLVEVDVSRSYNHKMCLAGNLLDAQHLDEAIALFAEVAKQHPDLPDTHNQLALGLGAAGRSREAAEEAERSLSLLPREEMGWLHLNNAIAYAWAGRRAEALALVEGYLAANKYKPVDSYTISECFAVLGDKDTAFEWLERAHEEHAFWMIWLKVDFCMAGLRSDPRYQAALKKAGYE